MIAVNKFLNICCKKYFRIYWDAGLGECPGRYCFTEISKYASVLKAAGGLL
jgi:hypothetical protein